MRIAKTKEFVKRYTKLPKFIQKKVDKQIRYLTTDVFHPSLKAKKMVGVHFWEARVDKSYRFTFEKTGDTLTLRTVGPHDEGLGKK
ncbi:MAG: DNA helicase [Candidatus Levybacteria bacterium]|nr:DNA helicase [Candidatus Levybacteria bacterium]